MLSRALLSAAKHMHSGVVLATMQLELRSEITCPHCGHRKVEDMPTDACQFFYECESCHALLRP